MILASNAEARGYNPKGFYTAATILSGYEDFAEKGEATVRDSWGLGIRVGNRYRNHFAVEADINYLPDFDVETPDNIFNMSLTSATGNIRAYLTTGRFQPFAYVGAGLIFSSLTLDPDYEGGDCTVYWWCYQNSQRIDDETEFFTKVGLGFDYVMSRDMKLSVDVAYNYPTGDLSDFPYTSIGLGVEMKL
jgi:hypothetical protein